MPAVGFPCEGGQCASRAPGAGQHPDRVIRRTHMSTDSLHFVAAAFPTNDGADFALGRLKTAQIKRGNVALLSRGQGDRLRISETHDWGMGKSAILGGLAAILVPGI